MAREFFCAYHSLLHQMQNLSDAECGRLFRALLTYSETGELINLQGREIVAFDFARYQIDRDRQVYDSKCTQNAANASKRYDRIRPNTNVYERTQEKEEEKEEEEYIYLSQGDKAINKKFLPPTVEEVQSYCRERGNNIDAQAFVSFYASKGWKVGKETMKDWRAAVRTWERRQEEDKNKPHPKKLGLSYSERMQVLKELHDEYMEAGV